MAQKANKGQWVQIYQVVLRAEDRAPQVPEDTKKVPLEMVVNGFLVDDAEVGEEVQIETFIGRRLIGILRDPEPSYEHKYGHPVPEILKIGSQLQKILEREEE